MKKAIILLAVIASVSLAIAGVQNDKTQATNLSSRGRVESGDNVLIGGFIIGGRDFVVEVIRALGPELHSFPGLSGVVLSDPVLTVYDENGQILVRQDSYLELDAQDLATLADHNLTPTDQRECAVIVQRPAGVRTTAVVTGKNGATGIALVEAYKIQ